MNIISEQLKGITSNRIDNYNYINKFEMHNKSQKINEQLIKANVGNQEQSEITILNLRSLKIGVITILIIQKIENLDWLINLEELNLSHNSITKMENLSKLTELKELNLSDNYIKQIQGID